MKECMTTLRMNYVREVIRQLVEKLSIRIIKGWDTWGGNFRENIIDN